MQEVKLNADGTLALSAEVESRLAQIKESATRATRELVEAAGLASGDILVVGCSTSEVTGKTIGHASVLPVAEAVFGGIYSVLSERGIYLAA